MDDPIPLDCSPVKGIVCFKPGPTSQTLNSQDIHNQNRLVTVEQSCIEYPPPESVCEENVGSGSDLSRSSGDYSNNNDEDCVPDELECAGDVSAFVSKFLESFMPMLEFPKVSRILLAILLEKKYQLA